MKNLLSLLLLTPILALAQELPDEDWLCLTEQANLLDIDEPVERLLDESRFLFNPSIGFRRFGYDAIIIDSTQCKSQNSGRSYICDSENSELYLNLFYLNAEDSVFLYAQTELQFNGEGKTVNTRAIFTFIGECDRL